VLRIEHRLVWEVEGERTGPEARVDPAGETAPYWSVLPLRWGLLKSKAGER
jgi:hypothetical protein